MNLLNLVVLSLESVVQIVGVRVGVEQPAYRTVLRDGRVELREYAPRIAAETVVSGDAETARNAGFRKIAGYIFGGNGRRAQVAMTAPVAQAAGTTIAMTAPVAQGPGAAAGDWRIQFTMPSKYRRAEDLPRPNDPEVKIVEEPAARYAVRRFTGSRTAGAVTAQTNALLRDVAANGWTPAAKPVAWFYDPPWTVPFARRNEVAVQVKAGGL